MRKKKLKYTKKYQNYFNILSKEQQEALEQQISNIHDNDAVIMIADGVICMNKDKVNVVFYQEIIYIKKKVDIIQLYGTSGLLGILVGRKDKRTDIILQELKDRNPSIKRVREKTKKKVKQKSWLERFYDGLTYRQQEFFYAMFLMLDLILFGVAELFTMLILVDDMEKIIRNQSILLMVFAVNAYWAKKMRDKYVTYWFKGVYYLMFCIKILLCIMGVSAFKA